MTAPEDYLFQMDANAVSVESTALFGIARKPSPKQAKVLAMLCEKPEITLQEAVAVIGTDIYANACKHVGVTLANMVKRGMLRRIKKGVFGLPNVQSEPTAANGSQISMNSSDQKQALVAVGSTGGSADSCECGKPATKTTDDGVRLCSECYGTIPNKYDLAFLGWFAIHGWQIHVTPSGVDVWTHGDARCPFRVTRGMIDRLQWSGKIERIFPRHAAVLDYVWVLSPNSVLDRTVDKT